MAKILLVDDDGVARDALEVFLSRAGHSVIAAADGGAGEQAFRRHAPDLVVLDVSMPGRDGVAVLRELAPELPRTGFIMLSGRDDGDVARACLEIGALDYLTKPADIGKLEGIISTFMQARRGPAR